MIPIPLVIALALAAITGLCWLGHRRCAQDDIDNAIREAAIAGQPADDETPAPSQFDWGHSETVREEVGA